jgi:hypothetical protein
MKNEQIAIPGTYHGPSDSGYNRVPSNGPHCPMTFKMAILAPLPSFSTRLSIDQVMIKVIAEKNPAVAGNTQMYRIKMLSPGEM